MSSILQLLNKIANDTANLRQDVVAIQRTLVRLEAAQLQPVCRTRRRSSSRATQTWTGATPSSNHHDNRWSPYEPVNHHNATSSSLNHASTIHRGNGTAPSRPNYAINSNQRMSRSVGNLRNNSPAGPAEIRLSVLRQVLNKAANTPVQRICKLHKNFGNHVDMRQCPTWCSRHLSSAAPMQNNEAEPGPSEAPNILMLGNPPSEQINLQPPLQPDRQLDDEISDAPSLLIQ